jgi:hypothetical protein
MAAKKRKTRRRSPGLAGSPADHRQAHRTNVLWRDHYLEAVKRAADDGACTTAFHYLLMAAGSDGAAAAEQAGATPVGQALVRDNGIYGARDAFIAACPFKSKR